MMPGPADLSCTSLRPVPPLRGIMPVIEDRAPIGLGIMPDHVGHRGAGRLDMRDRIVIAVVVQGGNAFPSGHGADQQIGQTVRSDVPAAPQGGLAVMRTASSVCGSRA